MTTQNTDKIAHTPGPWEATYAIEEDSGGIFAAQIYHESINSGAPQVAEVTNQNQEQCEANARLIAAAPELLEACKELIATMNSVRRYGAIEKIRAAISKAEGK